MNIKLSIQRFGGFLAGMVIPNIGAFIAWGLFTALFLETGWLPNQDLATLISPMLQYLLTILIAYTGGRMVYGQRGAVAGAVAASGAIFGSEIPMFLGAMLLGPLGGWVIKKFDQLIDGKVATGFEMLINNFSIGILGMLLAILSYYVVGPTMAFLTSIATNGVTSLIENGLYPLLAVIIEPAKVLFLNNAIDQGIFVPLGSAEILSGSGKTLYYMLVSSPAPGAGILIAYSLFAKGDSKRSAPSALLIQFIGGIHEVYFPYVLMKPLMFFAIIAGGIAQIIVWVMLDAGLAGYPHPGSIISFLIMLPKNGAIEVLLGLFAGILVTVLVAWFVLKLDSSENTEEELGLSDDITNMLKGEEAEATESKGSPKVTQSTTTQKTPLKTYSTNEIDAIAFACDAGIGSSAMGSSILKKKIKDANLNIEVYNIAVDSVDKNTKVIVTHQNLYPRARKVAPNAVIRTVENFLNDPEYDRIIEDLKEGELPSAIK